VNLALGLKAPRTSKKHRLLDQNTAALVIGMAVAGIMCHDEPRFVTADALDNFDSTLVRVTHMLIAEIEIFAELKAENFQALLRFALAVFGGAARAFFAARHVDHADLVAQRLHAQKRAGAAEFDIIGMRAEGEDLDGSGVHRITLVFGFRRGCASR
jgi:hypothetical protein